MSYGFLADSILLVSVAFTVFFYEAVAAAVEFFAIGGH